MDDPEPSLFYTGLVAEIYRHLRSVDLDPAPYAAFIRACGEPALELGCGDGDPMLDLIEDGLRVEGLDSSPDMLDRCRAAAKARQLGVTLHHSTIESMDLGRSYRSIFLAGATFNLLPDDSTAAAALERIAEHLEPGGSALIPLFVPQANAFGEVGTSRSTVADDATMRVTPVEVERNEDQRRMTILQRYEFESGEATQVVERRWLLHWHTQASFRALAEQAGLNVAAVLAPDQSAAADDATEFVFLLTSPS